MPDQRKVLLFAKRTARDFAPEWHDVAAARPVAMGQRLRDLLLGERAANAAVCAAIAIGFFHGWLKLKIRHPIATFLFDIPLLVALGVAWMRLPSGRGWLPHVRTSRALLAFYATIAVWFVLALVLPWGAPLLAALAAVRGWIFASLTFALGYHIISSRRQLHAYFILIILLAAATALYATRQTLEEVEALRAMDPLFATMTHGASFVTEDGTVVLRRFSTFISSGAFGGAMAVSLVFLATLLTDSSVARKEKLILLGLALLIGWGMTLSGSRSALLALGVTVLFMMLMRRLPCHLWWLTATVLVAMAFASLTTDGGITDRLQTLNPQTIWGRFYIVWAPGTRYLLESALVGGGLGKAAVGYPMSLSRFIPRYEMWVVDGDLGKTMAELGIAGVLVITVLFVIALGDGWNILRRRGADPVGTLALGAFCAFGIAVMTFPIGSPFLGIPLGVLTWFFLGAAIKLDQMEPLAGDTLEVRQMRGGTSPHGGRVVGDARQRPFLYRAPGSPQTRFSADPKTIETSGSRRARHKPFLHG
jgi:O-antigen ligase